MAHIGMMLAVALGAGGAAPAGPSPAYVGDAVCGTCHADFPAPGFFAGYLRSGHPRMLVRVAWMAPAPDTWPWTEVPPLPVVGGAPLQWSDVEYVIGNSRWKTRFLDRAGYLHTGLEGEATQWNVQTGEWAPYRADEIEAPYDCGRCHATGYATAGHQHGLPGLAGTWAQDGVQCEACHGPGGDHVAAPEEIAPPGGLECAACHVRDAGLRMPWADGFLRSRGQAEQHAHSPHRDELSCESCHDPHRSAVHNDGGIVAHCSRCHPGDAANGFYRVSRMENFDCVHCHMPRMARSAASFTEHMADLRGHLHRILTEPITAEENVHEIDGELFWNQDPDGRAFVTLDYACLGCHDANLTLEEAAAFADGIHDNHPSTIPCTGDLDLDHEVGFSDLLILLGEWGVHEPCPPFVPADIDMTCGVDASDLEIVLAVWGPCP